MLRKASSPSERSSASPPASGLAAHVELLRARRSGRRRAKVEVRRQGQGRVLDHLILVGDLLAEPERLLDLVAAAGQREAREQGHERAGP
jgi:hypothetical protein